MDSREFRNTLGHFATGVTVITTTNGMENIGLTANAFSSVSLEPPLILVCIDKKARSIEAFKKGRPFVVNILQQEQEAECWGFAKQGQDKFARANYTISEDGVPVLQGNLATIECNVEELIEGGDHYIITGKVKKANYDKEKNPLLFFRGEIRKMKTWL
ncbi:flavin reductase family protein [Bacillus norwichensis]|uniref:Flavin reductase family protein n=1 Tax=Bacillus norwichensis TaxID=2762217 RepID=A0ABR8VK81_9BACI|nr:flavin reductase family protein [Bacillus norwichensis]MBD8005168.1 flavin reductase family protein [Bacillus norwichensis]